MFARPLGESLDEATPPTEGSSKITTGAVCQLILGKLESAEERAMRMRLDAKVAGGALLLALCLRGPTAWAEGPPEDEEPRWIPSLHFGFETFDTDTKSMVENDINSPAQEGTGSNASRQLMTQLGGELMGPRFEGLPGRPRLFVQAGLQLNSLSDDKIFQVGDLRVDTELEIKKFQNIRERDLARDNLPVRGGNGIADCLEQVPEPTCLTAEPGDFEGQGSLINEDFQNPSWYAALGVAFDVPVAKSLLLQVKPSIAYNADRIDFSGRITTVVETEPVGEVPDHERLGTDRGVPVVHRGSASASTTHHSLGAGLELGLVLFRSARPIRTSLYADARFLWLLSDRTTTFSDSVASYGVRRDTFGIRAGAGVRFSWMGLGGR